MTSGEPTPKGGDDPTVEVPPSVIRSIPGPDISVSDVAIPVLAEQGRFRLLRAFARGGLGRIFVALDGELRREVALKELLPEHADDSVSRTRFLLEAEVTGSLEHPGVVPVYALGSYPDGRPYYAMRLIRGESLRQAIERIHGGAPSSRPNFASIRPLIGRLVEVCNAMAYAHSRGVLHRDLKPSNVMLGPYGETVVVDWGLAKVFNPVLEQQIDSALSARGEREDATSPSGATEAVEPPGPWRLKTCSMSAETLPGRAVGTPAYMSPEQAGGALDRQCPATDIYSVGATLYHVLTGRQPFVDSEINVLMTRVIAGSFAPPRQIAPQTPPALEAICLKAMAHDPESRYASMADLAADLERFLADEAVVAYREDWTTRLARKARRHKAWSVAAAATLLAVLALAALSAEVFRRTAARERAAREQGLLVAAKFAARTVAAEVDRRWRILQAEADDPEFVRLFLEAQSHPPNSPGREPLERWVSERLKEHQSALAVSSWIVLDAAGHRLARAPAGSEPLDRNFAYRDYFNGLGQDFPPGTPDLRPISQPHRSIVFLGNRTNTPVVGFSVPIFEPGSSGSSASRRVIGVLMMSIDTGHFGELELDLGGNQVASLVDLKADTTGRVGLILHHSGLAGQPANLRPIYLTPERVASLESLRQRALKAHRGSDATGKSQAAELPVGIDRDYSDPIGGEFAFRWLAAFEPVIVNGRPEPIDDTGWVVIVQEREDANTEPIAP